MLLNDTSDEDVKRGIEKLVTYATGLKLEKPRMDESIQVDVAVWPDLFWGRSKVALFLPEQRVSYDRLRVYDWHCYVISKDIDPEIVFANILREE